ncbi:hypothetical protein PISL3812_04901 [Talaromyces islandicus]|uniref:Uncharacterized protein n=1 Tax=Talaromyces islandicus TaxID=28573 RepID=A0A0U1LYX4_TALIS|nr:hypothetical protein PISL3812_04901 [Talaromyces islandicus]
MSAILGKASEKHLHRTSYEEYERPPPPYSNYNDQGQEASSLTFPSQPYHGQAPCHSFQLQATNWLCNKFLISDMNNSNTPLYTLKTKIRKPHMILKATSSPDTELATVEFHTLRPKVDVYIHGEKLTLSMKKFSYTATYESAALHKTLVWKSNSHWKTFDLDCVDDNSMPFVQISSAYYSCKQGSQIQFFGDVVKNNSVLMSELIATGLAMAQYINLMASTTVAASST